MDSYKFIANADSVNVAVALRSPESSPGSFVTQGSFRHSTPATSGTGRASDIQRVDDGCQFTYHDEASEKAKVSAKKQLVASHINDSTRLCFGTVASTMNSIMLR